MLQWSCANSPFQNARLVAESMRTVLRWLVILIIVAAIAAFFAFDLGQYVSLSYLKAKHLDFKNFYQENVLMTALAYFCIYVLVTSLSLPGALVLTVAGGAIFGVVYGTIIVSFASTIGATLAFLAARFVLRDFVCQKFGNRMQAIDAGMAKNGIFYLFTLRLVPIFPFFMINMLMGLTTIKAWHFFVISQVAMFLGTVLYVNAGDQIAHLQALGDILSPGLLVSFALLGIFPLVAKKIVNVIAARRVYRNCKRPHCYDYNLIVIGAGSAGLVSSYIGAAVKARTLLIEKQRMGGDCLNTGCVPSKALLKSAKIAALAQKAQRYGFAKIELSYEFKDIMERVQRVIAQVEPHDSVERYRGLGVDCEQGEAEIVSPFAVRVGEKTFTTRNIIVATGASPVVPPFPGLDKVRYYTADTIWELRERPARFLVLGGGPIGCELAQAFSRLGSQVTQIESGERILPREDPDVSQFMAEVFRTEGIELLTAHRAVSFGVEDGSDFVVCRHKDEEKKIKFDVVILALGRKATVDGFCHADVQLETTERGTLAVNPYLQTNYPNIYACGDVAGPYQFTHTSAHQAWYCAVNSLFMPIKFKVDYRVIPWCTFTDPEVAHVGLNETEARQRNIPFEITTYGIDDLDRAIADSEDRGFVKVLTEPKKDKVLGATIVGAHAGELITEFVTAMKQNLGLNKILGTIHIYPTFAEANKYLAGNWKKNHAPATVLSWLEKFHSYRRSS